MDQGISEGAGAREVSGISDRELITLLPKLVGAAQVLEELLAKYITPDSYEALVSEARGKSKRQIEELIARNFPKPDVPERIAPEPMQLLVTGVTGPGAGFDSVRVAALPSRLAPLLSHALPSGDLAELFERALDELIERETKRREGAGKRRARGALRAAENQSAREEPELLPLISHFARSDGH